MFNNGNRQKRRRTERAFRRQSKLQSGHKLQQFYDLLTMDPQFVSGKAPAIIDRTPHEAAQRTCRDAITMRTRNAAGQEVIKAVLGPAWMRLTET